MRVVVLSSTEFGRVCIEKGLLDLPDVRLVGILTTPKEIEISYSDEPVSIATHAVFDSVAHDAGCEVRVLWGRITASSYLRHLDNMRPDLLCAFGWYYMIPKRVRDAAPKGCVGIHASLLPKYRGGAPIPWAIINGETETGVSLFYLDEGVDTGDIIGQEKIPIGENDTCGTVYGKAMVSSIRLLREYFPRLAVGGAPRVPQEEGLATYYPQRSPRDGLIDWSRSAKEIRDFIRAQTRPYPGAFTYVSGKKVIIWDADVEEEGDVGGCV
jgi:methionyl-tRNA formyltransferase